MFDAAEARELARHIAENLPGPGAAQQRLLDYKDRLLKHADQVERPSATWLFNSWTGTLEAGDPGAKYRPSLVRVPNFAFWVPSILAVPGWPMRLWGESSRPAVHAGRCRLAERIEKARQPVLAEALHEVVLEQDEHGVMARYEPEGLPLRIAD